MSATPTLTGPEAVPGHAVPRSRGDRLFSGTARVAALLIVAALAGVFVFLALEGFPGLTQAASTYAPNDTFLSYVAPLVFGTVISSVLALILAVPFAFGIALFISHYAPRRSSWFRGRSGWPSTSRSSRSSRAPPPSQGAPCSPQPSCWRS